MTEFLEGRRYTRKQISERLGGGTQDFFPHSNGHVVCGCFKRELNPDAPSIVLPGNTDSIRRWAEVFASQMEAIPIFLKKRTNSRSERTNGSMSASGDAYPRAKTRMKSILGKRRQEETKSRWC